MWAFKNKHQSVSKVLKPAKWKQLRQITMKKETRPINNHAKAKFEHEIMTKKSVAGDLLSKYAVHFRAARPRRAGYLGKVARARLLRARVARARRGS